MKIYFYFAGITIKGAFISFDPNIRPKLWDSLDLANSIISKAASFCDLILPSFEEESNCFGDNTPLETINRYSQLGAPLTVVKDAGLPFMENKG